MHAHVTSYFDQLGRTIGAEFFLVGGCVRDQLRGAPHNDFDLVARRLGADELERSLNLHGRVEAIGEHFEVFAFFPHDLAGRYEIALPRTESTTGTGHKGFTPVHDPHLPIEEDLGRRDLTINSMAKNVHTGELHDPLGGQNDLAGLLLSATNPEVFADDPLRVLRVLRFVAQTDFTVDPRTAGLMTRYAHRLKDLPGERVKDELIKIVQGPYARDAFREARDLGVLPHFLPELSEGDGCRQNRYHTYTVFNHILAVLHNTETEDWEVKLAALFHDIGKPRSRWIDLEVDPSGNPHFYQHEDVPESRDHEDVGEDMTREIMHRLKFSNEQIDRVAGFVALHMFSQSPKSSRPAARRLIKRIHDKIPGDLEENVKGLFALRYGDCRGGKVYDEGSMEANELAEALQINRRFEQIVLEELGKQGALTVKDLAVNGHDLMQVGFVGAEIGAEQKRLLELVLEDPELNTKETLKDLAYGRFTGEDFFGLVPLVIPDNFGPED